MKRALAVLGAIVMIVIAVVIRARIDDNGNSSSTASRSGPTTIVCIRELESVCSALSRPDVTTRVEDASVTARALAHGDTTITGWVTLDPWPAIVNQLAQRTVTGPPAPLAKSDLVIAMVQERADRLAPKCGGTVGWKCLGDAIGKQWTEVGGQPEWGTVKVGIPPVTSAEGLLLLGNAASGYFNSTTFATNDFDDAFLVWKANVTRQPGSFTPFIQQFPAAFSAVGTTKREVTTQSSARPVATIVPAPAAVAVAVLVPVDNGRVGALEGPARAQLKGEGWLTDALDGPTGLPDAGVLLALSGLTG